ncbi:MAG: LL-diaminopimelate aminotransferase [Clostridiales bacterium]|nr:LL-diaminopimelate aminotransferase [Clostridiales bacterium]
MTKINKNYLDLKENYLFYDVACKVKKYSAENPDKNIIRLGIGDVTLPLAPAVISALHSAVDDMSRAETFKGYGAEQGYGFLKDAIVSYYADRNIAIKADEVFISDGAKSDIGNILDIFGKDNVVLVPDPVYPVYVDTNIMDGRKIKYISANTENNFLPLPDENTEADIIYICTPNNPTGAVYNKDQLKVWVDFANSKNAVILFDAAYEAFVSDPSLPRSIFEIEGARTCAIEFCSFSKTAGFTGTRCAYTIVPEELSFDGTKLNGMWLRRQTTKFNGVSYIVQTGAAAVFTKDGMKQIKENINYYRENAKTITDTLDRLGIWYCGGVNSPYIWFKCPDNMGSWEFFDKLLSEANVVGTPGEGFGENGKGFFRLTSFSSHENTVEAMRRFEKLFKKD